MRFEFATATRIVFGPGASRDAGSVVRALGARALLVTGRDSARTRAFVDVLEGAGLACAAFAVTSEPSVDLVREGVRAAAAHDADVLVGFGGGSAIDTAKAIAALGGPPRAGTDGPGVPGQSAGGGEDRA